MIEALLSGKLQGQPEQRTAKTGRTFVTARMRVAAGAEEAHFVRITAFSETACAALLALGDGDSLAVAGSLKVGVWTPQGGGPRPNLDMVAGQVLTVYGLERRRKATQAGGDDQPGQPASGPGRPSRRHAPRNRDTEDDFGRGHDDGWLAGGEP